MWFQIVYYSATQEKLRYKQLKFDSKHIQKVSDITKDSPFWGVLMDVYEPPVSALKKLLSFSLCFYFFKKEQTSIIPTPIIGLPVLISNFLLNSSIDLAKNFLSFGLRTKRR